MLGARVAQPSACSKRCPFWEPGGAVVAAGCALERILPVPDWSVDLAEQWLRVRNAAGTSVDWEPTTLFSILLE